MRPDDRIVFVGDVHIDEGDPALEPFLAFLGSLEKRCRRVILMGDLFNLWIGREEMEGPHHRSVVEALKALRAGGTVVRYLEGNRDYRVAARHTGGAFDDATDRGLVEQYGGHSIYAVHGDLANSDDRRYRVWRRLSRSGPAWAALGCVPAGLRVRFAERTERRLRSTNRAFKRELPEAAIRRYAAEHVAAGHDAVVLGHFHVERDWLLDGGGRVLVLPEWRESRRHLEIGADGSIVFADS